MTNKMPNETELPVGDPASTRMKHDSETDRPRLEWCRGICPDCGEHLVSNLYYVEGKGYMLAFECWASLMEKPTCTYRKVL